MGIMTMGLLTDILADLLGIPPKNKNYTPKGSNSPEHKPTPSQECPKHQRQHPTPEQIASAYTNIRNYMADISEYNNHNSLDSATRTLMDDIKSHNRNSLYGIISPEACMRYLDKLEQSMGMPKGLSERKQALEEVMKDIRLNCAISIGIQHMPSARHITSEEAAHKGFQYLEERGL